jgi:hypothetical protein
MSMSTEVAQQVADLINAQNELTKNYTAADILQNQDRYVTRIENGKLLGVAEVKLVQWYQAEILHVSVATKRRGIGTLLLEQAELKCQDLGARIAQCTIRDGNVGSEALFAKLKYVAAATFQNRVSGNVVTVYLKVLGPIDSNAARIAEETYQHYLSTRADYIARERVASEKVDQVLLAGAAGALALSVTFMEQLAPSPQAATMWMLVMGWGSLLASLALGLLTFELRAQAYAFGRRQLDKVRDPAMVDAGTLRRWNFALLILRILSLFSLVVGVIYLVTFAYFNVKSS